MAKSTESIELDLPPELLEQLRAEAERYKITVNGIIQAAIARYLAEVNARHTETQRPRAKSRPAPTAPPTPKETRVGPTASAASALPPRAPAPYQPPDWTTEQEREARRKMELFSTND